MVTGANKGIGLAIVETLLQQLPEAVVLLGSRDASRGWSAVFISDTINLMSNRYSPFSRIVGSPRHFSSPLPSTSCTAPPAAAAEAVPGNPLRHSSSFPRFPFRLLGAALS